MQNFALFSPAARTLKPEDMDPNQRYRPQLGFQRGSGYRHNKDPSAALRMIRFVYLSGILMGCFVTKENKDMWSFGWPQITQI